MPKGKHPYNMGRGLPKSEITPKRPKRITTIEDMLARDDVNDILRDLDKDKPNISELLVIYLDRRDGKLYYQVTKETLVPLATWMLEATKLEMLSDEEEEG